MPLDLVSFSILLGITLSLITTRPMPPTTIQIIPPTTTTTTKTAGSCRTVVIACALIASARFTTSPSLIISQYSATKPLPVELFFFFFGTNVLWLLSSSLASVLATKVCSILGALSTALLFYCGILLAFLSPVRKSTKNVSSRYPSSGIPHQAYERCSTPRTCWYLHSPLSGYISRIEGLSRITHELRGVRKLTGLLSIAGRISLFLCYTVRRYPIRRRFPAYDIILGLFPLELEFDATKFAQLLVSPTASLGVHGGTKQYRYLQGSTNLTGGSLYPMVLFFFPFPFFGNPLFYAYFPIDFGHFLACHS